MWRHDTACTGNAINKSAGSAIIFEPTGEAYGLDQPGIDSAIFFSSINARVPETLARCQAQQVVGATCPDQPIV
jgi:hypothetical protein